METGQQHHQSQLFAVRLWAEDLGDSRTEWRGQVQHVLSGETYYFRAWPTQSAWLVAMLPPRATKPTADDAQDGFNPS